MTASPAGRRRRLSWYAPAVAALLAVGVAPAAYAAPGGSGPAAGPASSHPSSGSSDKGGFYDARTDAAQSKALRVRKAALDAHPGAARLTLRRSLGVQGVLDMDPLTGTVRQVGRLDGFLTGVSSRPARQVVAGYLAAHGAALGLSAKDVAGLTLRQDYVDVGGTHHLSYVQTVGGVTVFDQGLRANVSKRGQLISLNGSPAAALPAGLAGGSLTATRARDIAIGDVGGRVKAAPATTAAGKTLFSTGDQAQRVAFMTTAGPRAAWQTITSPTTSSMYLHVVDAATGKVLYRRNLGSDANATGDVWDNYPAAPKGGTPSVRQLSGLPKDSPNLAGNPAHVYLDVNDDNVANPGEEVTPTAKGKFLYPQQIFPLGAANNCSAAFPCTWDPATPNSWQTNAAQTAVQNYYFVAKFHDHLKAGPIGFTRAAGNFEAVDGDAVQVNTDDGANTAGGLPDPNHQDNANFNTPPDGIAPRMQMYLFEDVFVASAGSDEADIVYHEYTHGLSNRLVVDANGDSTLGNIQAGSMGEAWSDWYANDFLVDQGFFSDTKADGDIRVGQYVGHGTDLIRTQPLDCKVGSTAAACAHTDTSLIAAPGGYTYGDFGKIIGRPEVHADGEIWGETLWDLRDALGSKKTENLVTRAMELSPANPSYLDERNAILEADTVNYNGKDINKIWSVFAHRGMGYFAGSVDGDDATPAEDFSLPPAANTPRGSLTGTVADSATNAPIAGVTVGFGGHDTGFTENWAAQTAADGTYRIDGIVAGTYPKVYAVGGAGYDQQVATVSVSRSGTVKNWALRRDWAALSGGGTIADSNDTSGTVFGCGPETMIDQSQGSGWSEAAPVPIDANGNLATPIFAVVKLPAKVDIAEIDVNPSGACGDAPSSSTGNYTLETSPDGVTWTTASSGRFGLANRSAYLPITLQAGTAGVQFLRYTMLSSQVLESGGQCPGAFTGCQFVDTTELGVYGAPSAG
jgi:extracellular elastinolytic metalloproteinase